MPGEPVGRAVQQESGTKLLFPRHPGQGVGHDFLVGQFACGDIVPCQGILLENVQLGAGKADEPLAASRQSSRLVQPRRLEGALRQQALVSAPRVGVRSATAGLQLLGIVPLA